MMKQKLITVFQSELFLLFFNATILYIGLTAVIIAVLQVPPEAILDSGLDEIIKVFEE